MAEQGFKPGSPGSQSSQLWGEKKYSSQRKAAEGAVKQAGIEWEEGGTPHTRGLCSLEEVKVVAFTRASFSTSGMLVFLCLDNRLLKNKWSHVGCLDQARCLQ